MSAAPSDDSSAIVLDTEAKIAAIRLRLAALPTGKEHKRQRTAANKELYSLENNEDYVAAIKARTLHDRAIRDAAEDAEIAASRLRDEEAAANAKKAAAANTIQPSRTQELHFRSLVTSLFDEYAPNFEKELVGHLRYETPAKIIQALIQARGGDESTGGDEAPAAAPICATQLSATLAVDLGCGTGLAGVALRGRFGGRLIGCDLAPRMLAVARRKQRVAFSGDGGDAGDGGDGGGPLYDQLEACDAVAYLHRHVPNAGADLIIAADVLVYMRSLDDLFSAVSKALAPSGLFAFSTEVARPGEVHCPPDGPGWIERPSERLAHLEAYLRMLIDVEASALELVSLEETTIRQDGKHPIRGHVVVVRKRVPVAVD